MDGKVEKLEENNPVDETEMRWIVAGENKYIQYDATYWGINRCIWERDDSCAVIMGRDKKEINIFCVAAFSVALCNSLIILSISTLLILGCDNFQNLCILQKKRYT